MSRIATLSTLLAAVLAAPLLAPASGSAADLRGGWRIGWPAATRKQVAPGARLRVVVAPARGRAAPPRRARLTIALTRVRDGRTLVRRTLRSGVVTVRVPSATGVRYVLSAKAGRRLLRRATLVVPARTSSGAQGGETPAAVPSCVPGVRSEGPASGTLTGDKRTLRYGETLTLTFANTSPAACLVGGVGYSVEQARAPGWGFWSPANLDLIAPAVGVILAPGRSTTISFTADDRLFKTEEGDFPLVPGHYRIRQRWQALTTTGADVDGTWEFQLALDDASRCGQPTRRASGRPTYTEGASDRYGHGFVGLFNDGGVCLRSPAEIALERVLGDGTTAAAATLTRAQCGWQATILPPRYSVGYGFPAGAVAPLLAPGRYRATIPVAAVPAGAPDQALSVTVDVTLDAPVGGRLPDPISCPIP